MKNLRIQKLKIAIFAFLLIFSLFGWDCSSSKNIMSLKSSLLQVKQAEEAFEIGRIETASKITNQILSFLTQVTELHSDLYQALKDQDQARQTSEREKEQTIEFGKLRDRANFLAGRIALAQGEQLKAVKYFVLVVESQRTTVLGERAYEKLRKIGFSPRLSINDQ